MEMSCLAASPASFGEETESLNSMYTMAVHGPVFNNGGRIHLLLPWQLGAIAVNIAMVVNHSR